jgi:hypothetical protein
LIRLEEEGMTAKTTKPKLAITKTKPSKNSHGTDATPRPRPKTIGKSVAGLGFIGGYLIAQGALTLEQLDTALLRQMELAAKGENLSLSDVLLRLGYITKAELAQAEHKQQQDQKARRA